MPGASSISISMRILRSILRSILSLAFLAGIACAQAPPESVAPAPATGPATATVPAPAPKAAPSPVPAGPNADTATPATTAPVATPTPDAAAAPSAATAPNAAVAPGTPSPNQPAEGAEAPEANDAAPEKSVDPATLLPSVPALPPQKASLIGGTVEKMDRVRDVLTIRVFGGGKMKIYFDPRTHILKNGEPAVPSDLRRGDRVSIDTILNGGTVFARNIRLNTSIPGESQGIVVSYNGGELDVRDMLSPRVLKLRLTPQTRVTDHGHSASATELVRGSLVSLKFGSQKDGRNLVEEVSVLAVPGRSFTFVGHVSNLDLRAGVIVLTSATDGKSYEIHFDPSTIQVDDNVAQAADVTILTRFDGSHYVASSVKAN